LDRRCWIVVLAVAAAAACARDTQRRVDSAVAVTVETHEKAAWRISYRFAGPQAAIDLGPSAGDFRAQHWRIEGADARLVERDGRDLVEPAGGGRFEQFSVLVDPVASQLRKAYEPFIPMGDGGVLFYTGHVTPFGADGGRLKASLSVIANDGASVSAFGETAPRFDDWESPFRHPAFLYIGKTRPIASATLVTVTDATAPKWIGDEIAAFAPVIGEALQELLKRALPTKPNIFVAMGDMGDEGRLNYSGDALPGQYQMTLTGGGWKMSSPEALAVLRHSTAHEAAHLWQTAARPRSDAVPDWIHEGGADALAADALVAAGYWTDADRRADFSKARSICEATLRQRSLQLAEAEARWQGVYACGHIINVAAAGDGGVAELWRALIQRGAAGGYDEALFMAIAGENRGADAVKAMRDLIRINDARPDRTIDRMLTGAPDLAPDLAADGTR
jgi:hypothetical protein